MLTTNLVKDEPCECIKIDGERDPNAYPDTDMFPENTDEELICDHEENHVGTGNPEVDAKRFYKNPLFWVHYDGCGALHRYEDDEIEKVVDEAK